ncbi:MAG: hypothetical protein ACR2H4_03675 [Pyrinomonadaceae bacterium]
MAQTEGGYGPALDQANADIPAGKGRAALKFTSHSLVLRPHVKLKTLVTAKVLVCFAAVTLQETDAVTLVLESAWSIELLQTITLL